MNFTKILTFAIIVMFVITPFAQATEVIENSYSCNKSYTFYNVTDGDILNIDDLDDTHIVSASIIGNDTRTNSTVAPYGTMDTGISHSIGYAGAEYIQDGNNNRIRQTGIITSIKLYCYNSSNLNTFKISIWRANGTNYDRIYLSDNLSSSIQTGYNTIQCSIPVTEGDYYGFQIHDDGVGKRAFGASSFGRYRAVYSYISDTNAKNYNWSTQSPTYYSLPLELYESSPDVTFIGDSLTVGYPYHYPYIVAWSSVTNSSATYPHTAANGFSYQNMGWGGQNTSEIRTRFIQDTITHHPKTISIMAGTNDIGDNVPNNTILENIEWMANIARTNNTKLIICSIPPSSTFSTANSLKVDYLNEQYSAISNEYDAIFINTSSVLGIERAGGVAGNKWDLASEYDCGDHIHLSAAGYAALGNAVREYVEPHGYESPEYSAGMPTDGIYGYWPLNGSANDYSGNNRNGTPNNIVWTNNSARFVGSSNISISSGFSAPDYITTSFEIKAVHGVTFQWLLDGGQKAALGSYSLVLPSGHYDQQYRYSNGTSAGKEATSVNIYSSSDNNQPVTITTVADYVTRTVSFYKNGQYVSTASMSTPVKPTTSFLRMGMYGKLYPLNGELSNVYISTTNSDNETVKQIYAGGSGVSFKTNPGSNFTGYDVLPGMAQTLQIDSTCNQIEFVDTTNSGPYTVIITVHSSENVTKSSETKGAVYQNVSIIHTKQNATASVGSIVYELDPLYSGDPVLTSNNTNATASRNDTHVIISTGLVKQGQSFSYAVSVADDHDHGLHIGDLMKWVGTGWDFVSTAPEDWDDYIGDEIEVTVS